MTTGNIPADKPLTVRRTVNGTPLLGDIRYLNGTYGCQSCGTDWLGEAPKGPDVRQ